MINQQINDDEKMQGIIQKYKINNNNKLSEKPSPPQVKPSIDQLITIL